MCYTLRDPISVGTYPSPGELRPRGKARNISVKSKCFDACLVVDGSLREGFNINSKNKDAISYFFIDSFIKVENANEMTRTDRDELEHVTI